jgi:hypothetical protein
LSWWQQLLDLELLTPDPGSFVPVHLGEVDGPVSQLDARNSLSFEPTAATVSSSQSGSLANCGPFGDRLDLQNAAKDLETHEYSLQRLERVEKRLDLHDPAIPG